VARSRAATERNWRQTRLSGISKRGDSYLRRLLVNGAHAALLRSKTAKADPWLIASLSP
jgi:transposase